MLVERNSAIKHDRMTEYCCLSLFSTAPAPARGRHVINSKDQYTIVYAVSRSLWHSHAVS